MLTRGCHSVHMSAFICIHSLWPHCWQARLHTKWGDFNASLSTALVHNGKSVSKAIIYNQAGWAELSRCDAGQLVHGGDGHVCVCVWGRGPGNHEIIQQDPRHSNLVGLNSQPYNPVADLSKVAVDVCGHPELLKSIKVIFSIRAFICPEVESTWSTEASPWSLLLPGKVQVSG